MVVVDSFLLVSCLSRDDGVVLAGVQVVEGMDEDETEGWHGGSSLESVVGTSETVSVPSSVFLFQTSSTSGQDGSFVVGAIVVVVVVVIDDNVAAGAVVALLLVVACSVLSSAIMIAGSSIGGVAEQSRRCCCKVEGVV